MNANRRNLRVIAVLAGLTGAADIYAASDQDEAIAKGSAHFRIFCTNCHGLAADGNGPLVQLLKIKPSDLTILSRDGNQEPITERVLKAVDGRHKVGEGQQVRMPVFSENLEVKTVYEIAEYVKSVQK